MRNTSRKRGFALVEIMVIVVVVALAAASTTQIYKKIQASQRQSQAVVEERAIEQLHVDKLNNGLLVKGTDSVGASEEALANVGTASQVQDVLRSAVTEDLAQVGAAHEKLVTLESTKGTSLAAASMITTTGTAGTGPVITDPDMPVLSITATSNGVNITGPDDWIGHVGTYHVNWTVTNANSGELYKKVDSGAETLVGSTLSGTLNESTTGQHLITYRLVGRGNGVIAETTFQVRTVIYDVTFDVSPNTIKRKQSVTISWDTNYKNRTIQVRADDEAGWTDLVVNAPASGSYVHTPPRADMNWTYRLWAGSLPITVEDERASESVFVTELYSTLTAAPIQYVYEGDIIQLNWDTNCDTHVLRTQLNGGAWTTISPDASGNAFSYTIPAGEGTRKIQLFTNGDSDREYVFSVSAPYFRIKGITDSGSAEAARPTTDATTPTVLALEGVTIEYEARGYTQIRIVLRDAASNIFTPLGGYVAPHTPADKVLAASTQSFTTLWNWTTGRLTASMYAMQNGIDRKIAIVSLPVSARSAELTLNDTDVNSGETVTAAWRSNYETSTLQYKRKSPSEESSWTTIDTGTKANPLYPTWRNIDQALTAVGQHYTYEFQLVAKASPYTLTRSGTVRVTPPQSRSCSVALSGSGKINSSSGWWEEGLNAVVTFDTEGYENVSVLSNGTAIHTGTYGASGSITESIANGTDRTYTLVTDGNTLSCTNGSVDSRTHSASLNVSESSIQDGQTAHVTWSTDWSGAYVNKSDGGGTLWTATSGSNQSVALSNATTSNKTVTFNLRKSDGASVANDSLTVTPAWYASCSINKSSMTAGDTVQVTYSTNKTGVGIYRSGTNLGSGSPKNDSPSAGSYTYELRTDQGNTSCGSLTVNPAPTYSISCSGSKTLSSAQSSGFVVTWSSNQSSAYAYLDGNAWSNSSSSGSETVSGASRFPSAGTYAFRIYDSGVKGTCSVTVTPNPSPSYSMWFTDDAGSTTNITSLNQPVNAIDPNSDKASGTYGVRWTVTNPNGTVHCNSWYSSNYDASPIGFTRGVSDETVRYELYDGSSLVRSAIVKIPKKEESAPVTTNRASVAYRYNGISQSQNATYYPSTSNYTVINAQINGMPSNVQSDALQATKNAMSSGGWAAPSSSSSASASYGSCSVSLDYIGAGPASGTVNADYAIANEIRVGTPDTVTQYTWNVSCTK